MRVESEQDLTILFDDIDRTAQDHYNITLDPPGELTFDVDREQSRRMRFTYEWSDLTPEVKQLAHMFGYKASGLR